MSIKKISQSNKSMTALLDEASHEPLILQTEAGNDFAVLPMDEDVMDLLLERSPRLIKECQQIRERMKKGFYLTHESLFEALGPNN